MKTCTRFAKPHRVTPPTKVNASLKKGCALLCSRAGHLVNQTPNSLDTAIVTFLNNSENTLNSGDVSSHNPSQSRDRSPILSDNSPIAKPRWLRAGCGKLEKTCGKLIPSWGKTGEFTGKLNPNAKNYKISDLQNFKLDCP